MFLLVCNLAHAPVPPFFYERVSPIAIVLLVLVEAAIIFPLLYRFGPRFFPLMFERDPVARLIRTGRLRAAVVMALRLTGVVLSVMSAPVSLALAPTAYMRSLDPPPPLVGYLGVPSAIWLVFGALLLASRRRLRDWLVRRGMAVPEA